jgi:hypothetical protein
MEQQIQILRADLKKTQEEVNQVLGDLGQAMELLMRTNQKALHSLQYQIDELNKLVKQSDLSSEEIVPSIPREGSEL